MSPPPCFRLCCTSLASPKSSPLHPHPRPHLSFLRYAVLPTVSSVPRPNPLTYHVPRRLHHTQVPAATCCCCCCCFLLLQYFYCFDKTLLFPGTVCSSRQEETCYRQAGRQTVSPTIYNDDDRTKGFTTELVDFDPSQWILPQMRAMILLCWRRVFVRI